MAALMDFEELSETSDLEPLSSGDESDETTNNETRFRKIKKPKNYKQKYRAAWEKREEFKNWLKPVSNEKEKAYCNLCHKELRAVVTALRKHKKTATHMHKEEALYGSRTRTIDTMFVSQRRQELVHSAEIKMAAFVAEHNLAFSVMDHFSELLPKLCPDSDVALHFKSKRTKTKCIVKNACAPYFHDVLKKRLQSQFFSLIIDETTDISTVKELSIVCRFYDKEKEKVISQFYEMIPVVSSTAESLYEAIISLFRKDEIELTNIIGFAADTTNTMYGEHNSVASRLKDANPQIYFMKCICHTAHLCASYACEKLPRTLEELLRDIYNYFAHSAKRQSQYSIVQQFADVEPHRILRPCQTRWLSLHSCVARVLEQWDSLVMYFQAVSKDDNLLVSSKILAHLQNPVWKLYFHFLNFALSKFTDLNVTFQSSSTSIHCLHMKVESVFREFVSCYMTESSWRHNPCIELLDPSSAVHFLPLNRMYMGAQVSLCLSKDAYRERSRSSDIHHFLKCAQDFFIEATLQIKKRFPLGDSIMKTLCVLDPNASIASFPSLAPLASRFSCIIHESEIEKLDSEWRRLSLADLPFDKSNMSPEVFWSRLSDVTDGLGNPQFSTLCKFMHVLLCLPCSNADVERVFSSVNNIKTKVRNKLHSSTVSSLIKTKSGVKYNSKSCVDFKPPKEIHERMQSSILYHSADTGSSDDESE